MFNSRIKLHESIRTHKFDLNLVISDQGRASHGRDPGTPKPSDYSKLCEKSILNNEGEGPD